MNIIEPHNPYDSSRKFFGKFDRQPDIGIVDNASLVHSVGAQTRTAEEIERPASVSARSRR